MQFITGTAGHASSVDVEAVISGVKSCLAETMCASNPVHLTCCKIDGSKKQLSIKETSLWIDQHVQKMEHSLSKNITYQKARSEAAIEVLRSFGAIEDRGGKPFLKPDATLPRNLLATDKHGERLNPPVMNMNTALADALKKRMQGNSSVEQLYKLVLLESTIGKTLISEYRNSFVRKYRDVWTVWAKSREGRIEDPDDTPPSPDKPSDYFELCNIILKQHYSRRGGLQRTSNSASLCLEAANSTDSIFDATQGYIPYALMDVTPIEKKDPSADPLGTDGTSVRLDTIMNICERPYSEQICRLASPWENLGTQWKEISDGIIDPEDPVISIHELDYYKALRVEAIATLMQTHCAEIGPAPEGGYPQELRIHVPQSCSWAEKAMKNLPCASFPQHVRARYARSQSRQYHEQTILVAKTLIALEAKFKASNWEGAPAEFKKLKRDLLTNFPHLAQFDDATGDFADVSDHPGIPLKTRLREAYAAKAARDSFWNEVASAKPEEIPNILNRTKGVIAARINGAIGQFCSSADGLSNQAILKLPRLKQAVDRRISQLSRSSEVIECIKKRLPTPTYEGNDPMSFLCIVGSLGPQAIIVAPVCTAYTLSMLPDYYDQIENADKTLSGVQSCNKGDPTLCDDEDVQRAENERDTAWLNFYTAAVSVGVDAAVYLNLARTFGPELLNRFASRFRNASRLNGAAAERELKAISQELDRLSSASRFEEADMRALDRMAKRDIAEMQLVGELDETRLLGRASSGHGEAGVAGKKPGGVYETTIEVTESGQPVRKTVAVKVYGEPSIEALGGLKTANRRLAWEVAHAKKFSEMGLGPKVYGVVKRPNGQYGLAMDVVRGEFYTSAKAGSYFTEKSADAVRNIFRKLEAKGFGVNGDFQIMVRPDGSVSVIDTILISLEKCKATPILCTTADEFLGRMKTLHPNIHGPPAHGPPTAPAVEPTVWEKIKPTQPNYPGSEIPKSFELTTSSGKIWVHGNATEHIAEYAAAKARNFTPEAVRLASQAQLKSLHAAVEAVTAKGITYDKMLNIDGWELIFKPPREPGLLPTLIHALYKP